MAEKVKTWKINQDTKFDPLNAYNLEARIKQVGAVKKRRKEIMEELDKPRKRKGMKP